MKKKNNNLKSYTFLKENFSGFNSKIKLNNIDNFEGFINLNNITNNNNISINHNINIDNNITIYKKDEYSSEKIINYIDYELNYLSYNQALIYDKRTYIKYYTSIIILNQLFIFSFFSNNNDYDSQIIKIFLFFFIFDIHFFINALFFNDNTIHQIYINAGNYNFIYQLPQIIYSFIISIILTKLIKIMALSEKNILGLKNDKAITLLSILKIKKLLKIKFIFFYIISFLLLILFTFYIICFCGLYINTQIHLIINAFISFGLVLIYPFGFSLLPAIFRTYALYHKNKEKKCMYKFSQLIQHI